MWDQKNLSAHYLIVNENTELILQANLTSTSFNLQDLFDTAFYCKLSSVSVNTYTYAGAAGVASAALVGFVLILVFIGCFLRRTVKPSR